jgi:apolipoprotein N-acyltransferase
VVVAAALSSALLLWLASPAVGFAPLAWVALLPAGLVALRDPASRAGRAVVPLTVAFHLELQIVPALPFGIAENQWGEPALPVLVGESPVVAAALLYVPAVGALLYLVRFPQPWPDAALRSGVAAVWVPALAWAGLDLLRARYDPSGLWGGLFLSQHASVTVQLSALAGPWLLTALQVAVGYGIALLLVRRAGAVPTVALVAVALVASAVGTLALGRAGGDAVAVAAVQPGYDTTEWDRAAPVRSFAPGRRDLVQATHDVVADLRRQTRGAVRRGAEVVVWPEAVAWVDLARSGSVRGQLAALARHLGAAVLVPSFDPAHAESAALAVRPDGSFTERAPKQRPMWFLGERAPDDPVRPLDVRHALLGVLLGVDVQDPGRAREVAARGATILVSSTHDWQELAVQQRALSRIAAASARVPLVRADWRFGSMIVGADGRLLADASGGRARTALVASVEERASDAPYLRVGDLLGWAGLGVFAACWAARFRARRPGARLL